MTLKEIETALNATEYELNNLCNNGTQEQRDFYSALDDLLKKQDRKTAAEIDCAACGRTEADRKRQYIAELNFNQELVKFLTQYLPKIK